MEAMMRVAEVFAVRSTCGRLQVGAIVTDREALQILGIGYNGAARGLANGCARTMPGDCGCIHAELNALLKAPGTQMNKRLFTTHSPCEACAHLILNSGIAEVNYRTPYRNMKGVKLLELHGVRVYKVGQPALGELP